MIIIPGGIPPEAWSFGRLRAALLLALTPWVTINGVRPAPLDWAERS